jgi:hypothetical protein
VPAVLAAATVTCFLERDFAVEQHRPGIPTEVLGSGCCLILSAEAARKQIFREGLRHRHNVLLSDDPRNLSALAATLALPLDDPGLAADLGEAGRGVPEVTDEAGLATTYEEHFRRAAARHATPRRTRSAGRAVDVLVRRHLPGTSRLAPALAAACLRDVNASAHDAGAAPRLALDAADALVRQVGETGGLPPRVVEVARFERDLLWLRVDLETELVPMFPWAGADGLQLSRPIGLDDRTPVRSNWLRVSRHAADVVELAECARAGRAPGARPADVPFLFVKTGDLSGTVRRVNSITLALLDLCDGRTTTQRLLHRMAEDHGCPREVTVSALRALVRAQAVRL